MRGKLKTMAFQKSVRETLQVMICKRGYKVLKSSDSEIHTNKAIFINSVGEKINIGFIKNIVTQYTKHLIIVYTGTITSSVNSIVEIAPFRIEFFPEKALMFNILTHHLVPCHEKVKKSDPDYAFCTRESRNLPVLLKTDAVAAFLGFLPGEHVRVTTRDGMVRYRVVV